MKPYDFLMHHKKLGNAACINCAFFSMQFQTMEDVWNQCPRPDWLLWILDRLEMPLARERRLFACWCADSTHGAPALIDPRSIEAVRVARLFAEGMATPDELGQANSAASDAADSAAAYSASAAAAYYSAASSSAAAAQSDFLRSLVKNPFKETP